MSIQTFIAERVFRPRALANRVLVVYDAHGLYADIVRGMARDDCKVIMAEGPLVDVRTAVVGLLPSLATRPSQHAVVWLPFSPPQSANATGQAQLQSDQAAVAVILGPGTVFPSGADDTLQAICLRAFPEAHARIHDLFREGRTPAFALINQLQQGQQWPELQAALGGRAHEALSSREIIEELLTREDLEAKLPPRGPWIDELRQMLENTMGLAGYPAMQRASEFSSYLWRTLLFSEFVFDASDDLPPALAAIPRATPAAKELVFSLCEGLRGKASQQDRYVKYANEVEAQLQLTSRVAIMRSLGRRDTFAFEEKLFLDRFCQAVAAGDISGATEIVELRLKSMWVVQQSEDGARLAEWQAARTALELLKLCMDFAEPPRRLAELAAAYQSGYHLLDRAHRLLEEALGQRTEEHDGLDQVANQVRAKYLECAGRLHSAHLRAIEVEGWPAAGGVLENAKLFDTVVEPLVRQGKRVAYLLIDSLRYELAVDLQAGLLRNYQVQLSLSYAQLPTYTEVGMASLMPQAKTKLSLKVKEDKNGGRRLAVFLGDRATPDPTTRFTHLREIMGDQCQQERIERFGQPGRPHVDPRTRLYVVRGSDIDEASHAGESRAMQQIPAMMREINVAIAKLVKMGFDYAVIATDHGFMLRPQHGAGDACPAPAGDWLIEKTRCFLGTGGSSTDPANFVIDRTRLGITGEFNQFVTPRSFQAYDGKTGYFHEGLSPQENFLPCLVVTLKATDEASAGTTAVCLNYRGKTKVTTPRPIIGLEWEHEDLIAPREAHFLIQAVNPAGEEIATIGLDDNVDPTIQRVTLPPGQATRFTLMLKDGFTGPFTVKVLDPVTLAEYCTLNLETNFAY